MTCLCIRIISTQMGQRELMLTVDRCGYGDGACAARVDVAGIVREGLYSTSPMQTNQKIMGGVS